MCTQAVLQKTGPLEPLSDDDLHVKKRLVGAAGTACGPQLCHGHGFCAYSWSGAAQVTLTLTLALALNPQPR
jgi:hypothetical protein